MVMKLRIPSPDWTGLHNGGKVGKCVWIKPVSGYDPFFDDEDEAIHICNGFREEDICPLRHECLIFALVNNEADGIWGGTHPHDRKRLRHTVNRSEWEWQPPTPKEVPEVAQVEPELKAA